MSICWELWLLSSAYAWGTRLQMEAEEPCGVLFSSSWWYYNCQKLGDVQGPVSSPRAPGPWKKAKTALPFGERNVDIWYFYVQVASPALRGGVDEGKWALLSVLLSSAFCLENISRISIGTCRKSPGDCHSPENIVSHSEKAWLLLCHWAEHTAASEPGTPSFPIWGGALDTGMSLRKMANSIGKGAGRWWFLLPWPLASSLLPPPPQGGCWLVF